MSAGYGGSMPPRGSSDDEIRFVVDAPTQGQSSVAAVQGRPPERECYNRRTEQADNKETRG